jgi:hypothetical protein
MRQAWAALLCVVACAGAGGADEPTASLLETPAPLAAALTQRFGKDLRILSLSVRPDGAVVEVQDPANPSHVDRYEFEEGVLGAPEPVQVGRNQRELKARLFAFAEVDLSLVPRLLPDALAAAETEQARAIVVTIERTTYSTEYSEGWSWPLIRVNVNGPRGGAVVEYRLNGKRKGVTRW